MREQDSTFTNQRADNDLMHSRIKAPTSDNRASAHAAESQSRTCRGARSCPMSTLRGGTRPCARVNEGQQGSALRMPDAELEVGPDLVPPSRGLLACQRSLRLSRIHDDGGAVDLRAVWDHDRTVNAPRLTHQASGPAPIPAPETIARAAMRALMPTFGWHLWVNRTS